MKVFGSLADGLVEAGSSRLDDDLAKLFVLPEAAEYLIQVTLEYRPKSHNKLISVQLFKISKKGFGHADEMLRWCAQDGCLGIIPWDVGLTDLEVENLEKQDVRNKPTQWPKYLQDRVRDMMDAPCSCPTCHNVAIRGELPDSAAFQLPTSQLAACLEEIWVALQGKAEFYMVRFKEAAGIQKAQSLYKGSGFAQFSDRNLYRKKIEKARDRDQVHYSLQRLLKDISTGKSVARAIQDLLEA